ncbi:MAG: OsmC family protein [Pseudomonadota bacterium]
MSAAQAQQRNTTRNLVEESGLPLVFKLAHPLPGLPKSARDESVRTYVNSLTVFQKEAFVTSRRAGQTWRFTSDEGKYLLGHDAAPAPLTFLTVGMVSSYMNEVLALAKARGIDLEDVTLIQDNYYSMQGSMRQGSMTASAKNVDLTLEATSSASTQELTNLMLNAVAASPLNGLMRGEKESLFTLSHNGAEIATDAALPLNKPMLPYDLKGGQPAIAAGDWTGIIRRGPITPKSALTNSSDGSSLTDQQDRILHLRGICTLRADGVKQIEQQLFNPHGSIFYFLSDEGTQDGGRGLAPNAASYISAGIGFCFMTQFGRFAKMSNSKLKEYHIIQDSYFSLGGASGATGQLGAADPLETHVHITSEEGDDFARYILDVSERTCFLHAFCRTDLKTKIKIRQH